MGTLQTVFKNLLGRIQDPSGKQLFMLPEKIKSGLLQLLTGDEEFILSLKTQRAIHKAPISRDSNTFYNSYAILTTRRLIIAKDGTKLNIFRELDLASINSQSYEKKHGKPQLSIFSLNSKYTLSFPPNSFTEAEEFVSAFTMALNESSLKETYCQGCGKKIPADSVYCSHCGKKTDTE